MTKFKSPFSQKNAASLKFLSPFWSTQGQQWPQFYNCKVTYNAMQSCTVEYFSQNKFNFQKTWYSLTKIVLTYNEKKIDLVIKKNFWIRGWRRRIWKIFEITRKIYSNSESSEQFLVTECFFTCSWRFLIPNRWKQLEFKLEKKILGFRNMQEKLKKSLNWNCSTSTY